MLRRASVASLLAVSLAIITGCGGDAATSTSSGGDVSIESLVTLKDLPGKATVEASLASGPCNPMPILASHGAEAAESPMFAFGHVRLKEGVGVFATPKAAAIAYDKLNATGRLECIGGAIETFGQRGTELSVKRLPSRSLSVGEEDALVRYLSIGPNSQPQNYVDVVSIKSGRSVAALIFLVESSNPTDSAVREVGNAAAGLLASAGK
jgi:hypothetical protein